MSLSSKIKKAKKEKQIRSDDRTELVDINIKEIDKILGSSDKVDGKLSLKEERYKNLSESIKNKILPVVNLHTDLLNDNIDSKRKGEIIEEIINVNGVNPAYRCGGTDSICYTNCLIKKEVDTKKMNTGDICPVYDVLFQSTCSQLLSQYLMQNGNNFQVISLLVIDKVKEYAINKIMIDIIDKLLTSTTTTADSIFRTKAENISNKGDVVETNTFNKDIMNQRAALQKANDIIIKDHLKIKLDYKEIRKSTKPIEIVSTDEIDRAIDKTYKNNKKNIKI